MHYTISMDRAGRLVIPKAIRDRIGVNEKTMFDADVVVDRIELTPRDVSQPRNKVVEKDGVLLVAATGKPFSAAEAVHRDREDRMLLLSEADVSKS